MSSLRVKQIKARLESLFLSHLDLSDIPITDKERDQKALTRCLAAYAIFMKSGCSEEEAAAAVWDGTDDNGVDAVFHDVSENIVLIAQSKWIHAGSGEPSASDIAVFANGVKDIVEQNADNFSTRLHNRLAEIGRAIMTPGATVEVVLVSTGSSSLAKHGATALERIVTELNGPDDQEPLASSEVIGISEIYESLARSATAEKITVDANITEWSFVSQPHSAYFGIIDGLQLKDWWKQHGKRLVAKNIRHSLGSTDVNNGIVSTATSNPENFWYFNNGITLVADEAVRAPKSAASRSSGNFQFKGASIVNGAQTVSSLGRVEDEVSLGKVRVSIRIVVLEGAPEDFGGEVTRTNNLQNRVEGRDFVAQDPEQLRLQQEMVMEGIDYQFLRSGDFTVSPTSCELIELTTALACASDDPALAVQVKTSIGRVFADLKKAPYKSLFNPTLSGAKAFNTILVQREIDKWIDTKRTTISKKSGYPWGALIHGNRILASAVFKDLGSKELSCPIDEFQKKIGKLEIGNKCEHFYDRMQEVLDVVYPGKFLAVLFKSSVKSKDVFSQMTIKRK